jgi:hypothetical protein
MNSTLSKAVYIALIVGALIFTNYLVQLQGVYHYEIQQKTELYDVLHKLLPDLVVNEWLIQIIPLGLLTFAFFQSNGFTILREFFFKLLIVLAIRLLTTFGTILPKQETCRSDFSLISLINGGCYDKIFSGHQAITTLLSLELLKYKDIDLSVFTGLNLTEAFLLVSTRAHYTVDVLLGFIISYLVYDGEYKFISDLFKDISKK